MMLGCPVKVLSAVIYLRAEDGIPSEPSSNLICLMATKWLSSSVPLKTRPNVPSPMMESSLYLDEKSFMKTK